MRTLVTGGAGYLGSVLVEELLSAGHRVRVLDNLRSAGPGRHPARERPGVEFRPGDVRDDGSVASAVSGCDAIVHLAAVVGYPACDAAPQEAWSTNVEGTDVVLRHAAGRPVVLTSSMSVLGRVDTVAADESASPRPVSLYGESKLAAERRAAGYPHVVVLRPATAFGGSPRMRFDLLLHRLTRDAVRTGRILLYEPDVVRCFVHVRDLATAIVFALSHAGHMSGETYHVGNQRLNLTKRELADVVAQITRCSVAVDDSSRDKDQRNYAGDFKKLAAAGLTLHRTLEDGVREVMGMLDATCEDVSG